MWIIHFRDPRLGTGDETQSQSDQTAIDGFKPYRDKLAEATIVALQGGAAVAIYATLNLTQHLSQATNIFYSIRDYATFKKYTTFDWFSEKYQKTLGNLDATIFPIWQVFSEYPLQRSWI